MQMLRFQVLLLGLLNVAPSSNDVRQGLVARIRRAGGTVEQVSVKNPELVRVNLSRTKLADADLGLISEVFKVHELSLDSTLISDEGFSRIPFLPDLQVVSLRHVSIGREAARFLARQKNLRKLFLQNSRRTGSTVSRLPPSAKLEEVYLDGSAFSDDECLALGKEPGVRVVSLADTAISDTALFSMPRKTQKLSLSFTKVSDGGLAQLRRLASLEYLALDGSRVSGRGVKHLTGLSDLSTLILGGPALSNATDMKELEKLKSLKHLSLVGETTNDQMLVSISELAHLEGLSLERASVTDSGLAVLRKLTRLRGLDLSGTGITDKGLVALRALKHLQDLNLSSTRITDRGLQEVSAEPNLRALDLSFTRVSDRGIGRLSALTKLEKLRLYATDVGDPAIRSLVSIKTLRFLDLLYTGISPSGYREIIRGLPALQVAAYAPLEELEKVLGPKPRVHFESR